MYYNNVTVTIKKASDLVKSNAERQRLFRQRREEKGICSIPVKGENGYFDERIRIAYAIELMGKEGELPPKFRKKLLEYSIAAIPPKNRVDELYIRGKLNQFLSQKE